MGEQSKRWKGGRFTNQDGYVVVVINPASPYFPMAKSHNRVLAHRLVIAMHLGRCLEDWEIVHHKNSIKADNRLENLELVTNHQNVAYERQDRELKNLSQRVVTLETTVRLLLCIFKDFSKAIPC